MGLDSGTSRAIVESGRYFDLGLDDSLRGERGQLGSGGSSATVDRWTGVIAADDPAAAGSECALTVR